MPRKVFNDGPRHNDTQRQYPRTLDEAFGPHCNRHIGERNPPLDWQDKVVIYGSLAALIGALVAALWGRV